MSNFETKPIHNSLATLIAWLSTCLLAGGLSMMFSAGTRTLWVWWGCFGLVAAVGLEAAERFREHHRLQRISRNVKIRCERELQSVTNETDAIAATRRAVDRVLQMCPTTRTVDTSRRRSERHHCDLPAELLLRGSTFESATPSTANCVPARLVNLSQHGFAVTVAEIIPQQQIVLIVELPNGEQMNLLAEVRWTEQEFEGKVMAGGRLIRALMPHHESSESGQNADEPSELQALLAP
jgi:hypothetical protein